jgi:hypothetical protein
MFKIATRRLNLVFLAYAFRRSLAKRAETARRDRFSRACFQPALVLLFASLLTIPLARQSCLDAALFARLQVVGMTLDFLDDVFLLNLPLKPA